MAFDKADLIRLPIVVLFDAFVASKFKFLWAFGWILGLILTLSGLGSSVVLFSCHPNIILDVYRLFLAAVVNCLVHAWNFSFVLVSHEDYYTHDNSSKSLMFTVVEHVFQHTPLSAFEVDFTVKSLFSFSVVNVLHLLLLGVLGEGLKSSTVWIFVTMTPTVALAFNISKVVLMCLIIVSNIPILFLFAKKFHAIRLKWMLYREQNDNEPWTYSLDNVLNWINDKWLTCRVPTVLRLYFIFKCVWAIIILNSEKNMFSNETYGSVRKSGIYYFFNPDPPQSSKEYIEWDTMGGYFSSEEKSRNLTYYEGMAVILTDSLISSFAVGSAISVVGHYIGIGLHEFVEGNGIMQGEALGMMSSVLFCLLSIQTGLSSLPPLKRIIRLYRNSFLLGSAILHFFLDVVQPVLMTISPQSHIPLKKHVKPLLVCVFLLIVPGILCHWIITTKPISTWMVALVAFNIELIVKVISTLLVYALYVIDARSHSNGIVNLDEYVFWIRSVSHVIEFICGLVMFVNGAYILFFESSNMLRAIMMSMHAYVNIYRTFREGLKTFNNRRTVNKRISSLALVKLDEISADDMDVCSICYQEFQQENGEVRLTNCKHMFHSSCLRKWIFIQDSCPMCDRTLFAVEEDKKEE